MAPERGCGQKANPWAHQRQPCLNQEEGFMLYLYQPRSRSTHVLGPQEAKAVRGLQKLIR